MKDFCKYEELKKFIDKQSANGGGDGPEAVFDGLKDSVVKCSWNYNHPQETLRYIIHIADAPPHGKEYSSGSGFPKGCPAGITLPELGKLFFQYGIRYRLYKCGSYNGMEKMEKKFADMFHDMKSTDLNNAS